MRTLRMVLLLASVSVSASAWSNVGHQAVCEIAWQEASSNTKDAIRALLAHAPPGVSTFAESCTWADGTAQKRARRPDHFINVPRYYYEIRGGQCRLGDRCLFSAIRYDINRISYSGDEQERLEALMYLGHWVGDIHQPLHVSYADDLGGNHIEVESDSCMYSLHSVWDYCVVQRRFGSDPRAIAQQLRSSVDAQQRREWSETTEVDWANESYAYSRRPEFGYCNLMGNVCWYQSGNRDLDLDAGESQKTVAVDAAYIQAAGPIVELRLQQAGVRLGALLNRLFDPPEYEEAPPDAGSTPVP